MGKGDKIFLVVVFALCAFVVYSNAKLEYARIATRVEVTQAKVDALADELQATTATLHDAIKRFKDRFMQLEGELKPMTPEEIEAFNDLQNVEIKSLPSVIVPTIVMHSGYDCGPCNAWISNEMQRWTQSGWRVNVVKEIESQRSWPWYEITDRDGSRFEVIGPLTNDTFHSARRGK
jgi:hypothetical protein